MTPADALALVVRTAAAVSWPVHEGARLAVRMVVQTHPALRTPELDAVLAADRLALVAAGPAEPPHVPAAPEVA